MNLREQFQNKSKEELIENLINIHSKYNSLKASSNRLHQNKDIQSSGITKKKGKLKENEILLSTLIDSIPYGMDIIDKSGKILFASEKVEKQFGEDIVGRNCWEVYRDDKKQCLDCPLQDGVKPGETKYCETSGIIGDKIFSISHTGLIYNGKEAVLEIFQDITTQKQAELELIENEAKFRSIFENMKEGVALHELIYNDNGKPTDYRIIDVNSAFEKILEIPVIKAKGALASILYGTGHAPFLEEYAEVVKTQIPYSFEIYFPPLKKHFHISVTTPISGFFTTIFSDITDLKLKENELVKAKEIAEENEIRFKAISEYALEGISLADMDGKYVFVNRAFAEMVGYSVKELLQMKIFDLKLPEEKSSTLFQTLKNNPLQKKGKTKRTTLLCKDDSLVFVDINATLLDIGKEKFALGIVRDVSDIVKWEEELIKAKEKAEESDYRLKLAIDSGKLGIWDWDIKNNQMIWNDRMYELWGKRKENFEHNPESWSNNLHPDDKEKALKELQLSLSHDKEYNSLFRIIRPDNTIASIKADAIVIRDQNNTPTRMIGINKDITDVINYQNELIEAKQKAEESDRLKSAFLTNVSHEIRTPMNAIFGFLSLLYESNPSEDEVSEYIYIIKRSGERLMNTIDNIIEISKIEIGDIRLNIDEVDISESMQYYFDFFVPQAKEHGLKINLSNQVNPNQSFIKTDKHKLDSIMLNLIDNAIKFTNTGQIEIGNYIEKDKLYFYVSDSGKGIPQDKVDFIFNRFIQVELGNTRGFEGCGIGLSIVNAYVKALGGHISVKSEIGKGSTFLFYIPFQPVDFIDTKPNINTEPNTQSLNHTLLIAEDSDINYYFLQKILSKDYNLLRAISGDEAVKVFEENPEISIIVMDIKMPGKYDGFEAISRIREKNQDVPIIVQTAYAMEDDRIKAYDAGCNDYITKPFKAEEINSLIKEYCIPDKGNT